MKLFRIALVALFLVGAVGTTWAQNDHLLCYQPKGATKFTKGQVAFLDDDFDADYPGETKAFDVKKPKFFCAPTDKNGEGVNDTDTHWITYQIKQAKGHCNITNTTTCKDDDDCPAVETCNLHTKYNKKADRNRAINVLDQFNNHYITANKVEYLMVPATADLGGTPQGIPALGSEEHFKCYQAKAEKGVCTGDTKVPCKKLSDCTEAVPPTTGPCLLQPKFPKETHPKDDPSGDYAFGLTAAVDNELILNGDDPGQRTVTIKKLKSYCQPVDKNGEGTINTRAGLLCYQVKPAKSACKATASQHPLITCKDDEDCGLPGTGDCEAQLKFNKNTYSTKAVPSTAIAVEDQFDGDTDVVGNDHHEFGINKEALLCVPACQETTFTTHVARIDSLSIPATGDPGDGVDVDSNGATCAPGGSCSGGIDNAFGVLVGFAPDLNTALADAITAGDINLVIELDTFADGSQTVNAYTATLDPGNPACDINDGASTCDYLAGINTNTCGGILSAGVSVSEAGLLVPRYPVVVPGRILSLPYPCSMELRSALSLATLKLRRRRPMLGARLRI